MGQQFFIKLTDGKKLPLKQEEYHFRFKCPVPEWVIPERVEVFDGKDEIVAIVKPSRAGEILHRGQEIRL